MLHSTRRQGPLCQDSLQRRIWRGVRKILNEEARVNSEGEQLRFPPSDGSLNPIEAPCLPFSGGGSTPALRPRGHTPLEPPTDLSPRGKPRGMQQISQGDSPLMICSITVRSFLRALARWLIRFFTLGGSSAKVLDISGTRKRGS
jgi:hypothetical protein